MVKTMERLVSASRTGRRSFIPGWRDLSRRSLGLRGSSPSGAYAGGGAMIVNPESGLSFPRSFLEGAPFDSFLIPGILLVISNGVLPTVVAVGALRRRAVLGHVGGTTSSGRWSWRGSPGRLPSLAM